MDEFLQNDEEKCNKQLYKDFNKTKEDLDEYINIMRKWADTQPHFPEKPSYRILRFVILYNKFSIEQAKQKLDMFYTIRNLMPEHFRTTPFSEDMVFQHKVWYTVVLPKETDDYTRIIYERLNPDYSDSKYLNMEKMYNAFLHLIQYLVEKDLCYRFHYILDCAGLKIGHAANLNVMVVKKSTIVLEKVFSNRMVAMYFVNFPAFLETILNKVIKPLFNQKMRDRIKVDSSTNILFEAFGKERLPKDIGGNEKSFEELNDMLYQEYEQHKDRFLELASLGVDESLRPAKLENDELLGYYGNFKTINVD